MTATRRADGDWDNVPWSCPDCGFESTTSATCPTPIEHPCDECRNGRQVREALRPAVLYRIQVVAKDAPMGQVWGEDIWSKSADEALHKAKLHVAMHTRYASHDLEIHHWEMVPK